jgi:hypothetical protein
MVIGIDFDNTLAGYDEVFFNHALEMNLIGPQSAKTKKNIRDSVRLLSGGDVLWQKMQAFAYGEGMTQARLYQGAGDFLRTCVQSEAQVYIISHKTEYSPFATTNLRQAAMDWMADNGFFGAQGLGLSREQIFFEPTREEKIGRLSGLGCTHFIDDLPEVFLEATFPPRVEKILFAPSDASQEGGTHAFKTWTEIHEYVFGR